MRATGDLQGCLLRWVPLVKVGQTSEAARNFAQPAAAWYDNPCVLGKVRIRRLSARDVEVLRAVRLAALRESPDAFRETLEAAQHSDWQARTASASSFTDQGVFIALRVERPIGMILARCAAPAAPAFLGGMWVEPAFRRRGIGRLLEPVDSFFESTMVETGVTFSDRAGVDVSSAMTQAASTACVCVLGSPMSNGSNWLRRLRP